MSIMLLDATSMANQSVVFLLRCAARNAMGVVVTSQMLSQRTSADQRCNLIPVFLGASTQTKQPKILDSSALSCLGVPVHSEDWQCDRHDSKHGQPKPPRHYLARPVISSGNASVDTFAHFTSWLAVLASILTVGLAFAGATQQCRHRHPYTRLPRAFWLFLALALVALPITNGLRYEHKRLAHLVRSGSIDLAKAGRDTEMHLGKFIAIDRRYNRTITTRAQQKADLMKRRFEPLGGVRYATAVNEGHERGSKERVEAKY